MKLCAIYNIWDDWDLLVHSVKNITPLVDQVIIIVSKNSNFGEEESICPKEELPELRNCYFWYYEPEPFKEPRDNETAKRNFGLQKARELGYTHFLMMDADEFYEPQEFLKEKERFKDPSLLGLVCRVKCYFRSPTLTIGYDTTLVPFIHKLTPELRFCFNREYPFAWTDVDSLPWTPTKKIRIDPTRSMNIDYKPTRGEEWGVYDSSGVRWSWITMHHYSWVRKDIKKKIRNSTARQNLERSSIVSDYRNAKPGYFCKFYGKTLEKCPDVFGLPEITDVTSLQ